MRPVHLALLGGWFASGTAVARAQGPQQVFVVVADSVPMAVPAAASAIAGAFTRQSWTVLATHPVAGDRPRCDYGAHVVVVLPPARTPVLLAKGAQAAFAVPVRIAVFEDEGGVHVSMVNPLSIDRTIAAETGLEASGRTVVEEVAALVVSATGGRRVARPYGQVRDRGLIGKTMGVMAGGPFTGQVKTISSHAGGQSADVSRVADEIWRRLQQAPAGEWRLRGIYRLDLAEQGIVILGVSGAPMEAKAFRIVGAGNDEARSGYKCPGLAYAASFPLEVVVRRVDDAVRVEAIDAMFRMKMYFEDAGRMKFARNMGMPGSIFDDLKALVTGTPR